MYIKKQNMNLYHVNIDKNQYYLLQLSQRGAIKWLSKWMKPNCIGILSLNKFCTAIVIHDPFSFNTCAFQRWLEYGVCRRYSLFKIYNSWGKTKSWCTRALSTIAWPWLLNLPVIHNATCTYNLDKFDWHKKHL